MDGHIEDDGQKQCHRQTLANCDALAVLAVEVLERLVSLLFDKAPARMHREVNASVAWMFVAEA